MPPSAAEAFVFSSSPLATGLGRRSMLKKPYLPPPSFFKNGGDQRCVNPYCQECPPPSFLCSVIGDSSSADKDISTFGQVLQQNISFSNSRGPVYGVHQRVVPDKGWKGKLLKASNVASMLCVLDCTILPLITVVLPLFGFVAGTPAQMEYLHELGHKLALFFVMPVGALATTINYTNNHRKLWIAALGYFGLLAVFLSNAGCHWAHDLYLPGHMGHFLHESLEMLHHGIVHRVANLMGCFLLLFSNYMSHRSSGGCKDPSCSI